MSNLNFMQNIEFEVAITRLPNVQFSVQKFNMPSVTTTAIAVPTPFKNFYTTPDNVSLGELNLSFLVDENMDNYTEVFNWLFNIAFPESASQYTSVRDSAEGLKSDISVVLLNSAKRPFKRILFTNCVPTGLSEISFDTTQSSVNYPEVTATFTYDVFKIENL